MNNVPTEAQRAVNKGEYMVEPNIEITDPTIEEVTTHCREQVVDADDSTTKCVDGGYRPGESEGAIAFTGADVGLCAILATIKDKEGHEYFTDDQLVDLVYDFAVETKGGFDWHTDSGADDLKELPEAIRPVSMISEEHDHHHSSACGCGFFNQSMIQGESIYGASADRLKNIHKIIIKKQNSHQKDGTMRCVVLKRNHNERGIIIVTGVKRTVRPWAVNRQTGKLGDQFFVFDKTRFEIYLAKFADSLQTKGYQNITYKLLIDIFDAQLMGTLGLLNSSQNKPIYLVDLDDLDDIKVTQQAEKAPQSPPPFMENTTITRS